MNVRTRRELRGIDAPPQCRRGYFQTQLSVRGRHTVWGVYMWGGGGPWGGRSRHLGYRVSSVRMLVVPGRHARTRILTR